MPVTSYSVSGIQDYIKCIIKKHETLHTNPCIHICISGSNKRLMFKIKDRYKLELQMPETIKLFCCTKKLTEKGKTGENVLTLEVVKVALIQCNIKDNQHQQKFELLYSYTQ